MGEVIANLCDGDEMTKRRDVLGVNGHIGASITVSEVMRWFIGPIEADLQDAYVLRDTIGAAL